MVKYSEEQLDLTLRALSDVTRRAMLTRLSQTELNVSELAEPLEMSLAAVSKHLKVLEKAALIQKIKSGRNFRCRANLKPLQNVAQLLKELEGYWNQQLDALAQFLSEESLTTNTKDPHGSKRKK